MSLTSKYDNSHHCLPEPLLALPKLRQLLVRFPSLTGIQNTVSKLTSLEVLRVEGLQQTLLIEPGALINPCYSMLSVRPQPLKLPQRTLSKVTVLIAATLVRHWIMFCLQRAVAHLPCWSLPDAFAVGASMPHALTGQLLLLSSRAGAARQTAQPGVQGLQLAG